MKFKITIASRIGLGFGFIITALIISIFMSNRAIHNIRIQNQILSETIDPSINNISLLKEKIYMTENLISQWLYSDRDDESFLLARYRDIQHQDIPAIHQELVEKNTAWTASYMERYLLLHDYIDDSLFQSIDNLCNDLIESGEEEPEKDLLLEGYYLGIEPLFKHVYTEIDYLQSGLHEKSSQEKDNIDKIFIKSGNNIILIQLIIAFCSLIIALLLIRVLIRPINKIKKALLELGKGELPDSHLSGGADEVGQMATALNSLIQNLKLLSNFSQEIGKGNFRSDFKPLSEKDILGNSLLRMREDLKNAALEEEKRKEEDEIRNWSTQGIARFSEILREFAGNYDELSFQVISNLVKYLEANTGGLFLVNVSNKGEKYLELVASYAFDRRKYLTKQIQIGEGLAGRAVQEGESIYMTDIPGDYIKIKSGLGENRPKSLLIVPLKLNEEIQGVVEIASLKEFMPHQIEFVERICNSIASSLSSAKPAGRDDELSPLSLVLSGDVPTDSEIIEKQIKKIQFVKEQLTKRENELKQRIADNKK
ncbi:MAG: hypothetical protein AMS27_13100 [Bacteroides sp. SM23_62_1]|nr:MAG: hypothetical protein AMS27_13100 [Bacteroides sp. SM23_62_1]